MTVRVMRLLEVDSKKKGACCEIGINFRRKGKLGEEITCYIYFLPLMQEKGKGRG